MKILLLVIGSILILTTLLPLTRRDEWWFRIFDFPRLQIVFLLAVVLAAFPFLANPITWWESSFLLVLAVCLFYQGYMMYPYTRLARKQVQWSTHNESASNIKLLFANVLMDNRNAARLRDIIRAQDPDVILAVETNDWWQAQLAEFAETHPHTISKPLPNTYGMLLYSRLELVRPEIEFLVEPDIPSFHSGVRLPSGKLIEIHCLHPRPPFPTESDTATERDAELLIVGRAIKGTETPAIVMGDLNDVAWSRTNYLFQDVSGLLDPRIGRGFYNTFHASLPFIRFPLDHFFHSNHFRLIDLKRLPYYGSDHFPVLINLSYEPDAEHRQEELRADPEQIEEAHEKIAKAMT